MALVALPACPKAGLRHGATFEAPGAFRIGVPGDGWEMKRNLRWGARRLVDWHLKGHDVEIRVTISPISEGDRRIPLLTMAQAITQNYGRTRGILTEVATIQRVDFGAHEGLVVYADRKVDLVRRRLAQVFVRAGRHLVMVSYIAPVDLYDVYAPDFGAVCERFAVLLPPDPPSIGITLPEDLPQGTPPPR